MVNISTKEEWRSVPLIDETTIALGGSETEGPNIPNAALTHRTDWLKAFTDAMGWNPEHNVEQFQEAIRQATGAMKGGADSTEIASLATAQSLSLAGIAEGRLSLKSGDPNPTDNQLSKTELIYTQYNGNNIALYNTTQNRWDVHQFDEIVLDISGLTENTNYDIFCWNNNGNLVLEPVAWGNSGAGTSERSVSGAISRFLGVWTKTNDRRRWLGTIRTTAIEGEGEDSKEKRFVYNANNQCDRLCDRTETTSIWVYDGGYRYFNNNPNNKVSLVIGQPVSVLFYFGIGAGGPAAIALGLNQAIANSSDPFDSSTRTDLSSITGFWGTILPPGYHEINCLERTYNGPVNFEGTPGQNKCGVTALIRI